MIKIFQIFFSLFVKIWKEDCMALFKLENADAVGAISNFPAAWASSNKKKSEAMKVGDKQ